MFDLTSRLDEPAIRELIAFSVGHPSPEKLELICQQYRSAPNWKILGVERNDSLIGCIGLEIMGGAQGLIHCISVSPSARRQGWGQEMLNRAVELTGLTQLVAETDQEAVGFYSRCGFQIISLGELYPGVERFRCVRIFAPAMDL